jgi:hypothetical protein
VQGLRAGGAHPGALSRRQHHGGELSPRVRAVRLSGFRIPVEVVGGALRIGADHHEATLRILTAGSQLTS